MNLTEDTRETLWVTDAELIRRIGCPEKIAREAIRTLDRDPQRSGFPRKEKLWGDRRYWPSVKAYFDTVYGLKIGAARVAPESRAPHPVAAPYPMRDSTRRSHG